MPTKRMSVDEMISLHKGEIRQSDGILFKASAKVPGSWDDERRAATFVMSAEVRDRTGDIISIAGMDTAEFEKNPVALWSHAYGLPIGTWSGLEKKTAGRPKRLEGVLSYAPEGTDETADRIARLTGAGIVKACSVGIMVDWNEVEVEFDEERRIYTWMLNKTSLVECSPCSVPANQMALAKAAGEDRRIALDLVAEVLDAWGKTPAGMIVPRDEAEAAWKALNSDKGASVVVPNSDTEGATVTVTRDGTTVSAVNVTERSESLVSRLLKSFGFHKEPDEPVENTEPVIEPATPEIPKLATAEEKAAAAARADAVNARVERLLN